MCWPGSDGYDITEGEILFDGEEILETPAEERAAAGIFLAFQYPLEIPGVATMTFLKAALNAQRKARGEGELTTPDFMRRVKVAAEKLNVTQEMLRRPLNVGFSGGEKKRNEILQMALLEPKLAILDETDSGLDIDALRIVSDGVNALRSPDALHAGHHALSAPARPYRAGRRACACRLAASSARAGRNWRWNSKPMAMPATSKRRPEAGVSDMNAEPRILRTQAEDTLAAEFAAARTQLPAARRSPALATPPLPPSRRPACRIAASRPGNTRTCARCSAPCRRWRRRAGESAAIEPIRLPGSTARAS